MPFEMKKMVLKFIRTNKARVAVLTHIVEPIQNSKTKKNAKVFKFKILFRNYFKTYFCDILYRCCGSKRPLNPD